MTTLTAHSCLTLVKIKKILIIQICCSIEQKIDHSVTGYREDVDKIRKTLENNLTYIDIGRILFGKKMSALINFFIVFTQLVFSISFHIVIGNILHELITENVTLAQILDLGVFVLVLCPLPLFLLFVLIGRIRDLGVLSTIACLASVTVFALIVSHISLGRFHLYNIISYNILPREMK